MDVIRRGIRQIPPEMVTIGVESDESHVRAAGIRQGYRSHRGGLGAVGDL